MKDGAVREGPRAFHALAAVAVGALALGLCARLWRLGLPPERVWDEIYFPVMASGYLQGVPFFDLHPPLGKFFIALGILVFGDTPVGWRIVPALFGCATVALGGALGWSYLKDQAAALLLAAFVAVETVFVLYSRTGIMDGILVFFVLATFLAALRAEGQRGVAWAAVMLGLAISVKWAAVPVAVPAGYVLWRKGLLGTFVKSLWAPAVIYVLIVYAGQLLNPTGRYDAFVEARGIGALWSRWALVWQWHLQALDNVTNPVPNDQSSAWWSWPLMLRPIHFYLPRATPEGGYVFISSVGNPLLWWGGTLAILAGAIEVARQAVFSKESVADHPLVPALLGYAALLAPWIPGTRLPYLYNYLPSYAFALVALTWWASFVWDRGTRGRWAVLVFAVCAAAAGAFFLPVVTGLPLDWETLHRRLWLDSWSPSRPA